MFDPRKVLLEYPLPAGPLNLEPVSGGFSGALVWKVTVQEQSYALKASWWGFHPAYLPLSEIHKRIEQARLAGLAFVPRLIARLDGASYTELRQFQIELSTWQPGQAVVGVCSAARVEAAIKAVAQVHAVWRPSTTIKGVCFGVLHQWQRLNEWTATEIELLRSSLHGRPDVYTLGAALFMERRERAIKQLKSWLDRKVLLHYCLGDVWSAHVLFTGDEVTGLIDYGGMRLDHPAQDLARLLGSLCQGDARLRQVGLDAYPGPDEMKELGVVLEKTGGIVAIGNWLRWLFVEKRLIHDPENVEKRFTQLVEQQSRD